MNLFEIYTEENGKDVDFGIHGAYSDNEKDAIKYVETEIVTSFFSMGYRVKTERTPKHSIVHVWDDKDIKYRRIVIWAIEKEKENTINKIKSKDKYTVHGDKKMTKEEMMNLLERAKILLKATKGLLEKQESNYYVLNLLEETVFYDEAECDGNCLKNDINYWLDELEE